MTPFFPIMIFCGVFTSIFTVLLDEDIRRRTFASFDIYLPNEVSFPLVKILQAFFFTIFVSCGVADWAIKKCSEDYNDDGNDSGDGQDQNVPRRESMGRSKHD